MTKAISSLLVILSFFLIPAANGQQDLGLELQSKIKDKNTLPDIMREVNAIYDKESEEVREKGGKGLIKYKHWKRWEYQTGRSLGENGQFVNRSQMIYDAFRKNPRPKTTSREGLLGSWAQIGLNTSSYSNDTLNSYSVPNIPKSYANGVGRVDRIAFHPTNKSIYYIATPQGGLWKTIDDGLSWTCLTDNIPSIGISGIVVDRINPETIFILTGTADNSFNSLAYIWGYTAPSLGVLVSTNGGTTWYQAGSFPLTAGVTDYVGYDLIQDYTDRNVLLAATTDGIFRSSNFGATWTKVKSGTHFDLEFNRGLAEKASPLSVAYATTDKNIFYSLDGGATWKQSSLDIAAYADTKRIAIATSYPGAIDNVVAVFGAAQRGGGAFAGVYQSTDGGLNFTRKTSTPNILGYEIFGGDAADQGGYDLCIAISPPSPNYVFVGGINVWGTSNMLTNATFTSKTMWYENQSSTRAYIHPDQHDLAYSPLGGNRLFACNDGGLYRSTDDGATWTNLTQGLFISQFYHLSQSKSSSYIYAGGLQDNGVKYRAKGTSDFTHMAGADGFSTSFIAGSSDDFYLTRNNSVLRGKYSDGSIVGLATREFFPHILAHPVDPNIVFLGGAYTDINGNKQGAIWKSIDQGDTWIQKNARGSWAMAISESDPSKMYAAGSSEFWPGDGSVYYSSDSGDTWTTISNNSGFPASASYNTVTDIVINPNDPNSVYVSVGGYITGSKVYFSADAGQNWSNYSYDLPNVVVHSLAVTGNKVYAGSEISLYSRTFGTGTWVDVGDNLPIVSITEILTDSRTGKLTIATFGRGVWERAYCIPNVNLTEDLEGQLNYQSSNIITSSSLIPGNDVDNVSFKAGGKVVLSPGFQAKEGSYFEAKTDGCTDGGLPSSKKDQVSKK